MSEFGDLKRLREVLDSLDPPMVMIGHCKTCVHFHDDVLFCDSDKTPSELEFVWPEFGCVYWTSKP